MGLSVYPYPLSFLRCPFQTDNRGNQHENMSVLTYTILSRCLFLDILTKTGEAEAFGAFLQTDENNINVSLQVMV